MAIYDSSSSISKLIKEKFGRSPRFNSDNGKQEIEDLDFVRSFMYENDQMCCLTNPVSTRRLRDRWISPTSKSQTNLDEIKKREGK